MNFRNASGGSPSTGAGDANTVTANGIYFRWYSSGINYPTNNSGWLYVARHQTADNYCSQFFIQGDSLAFVRTCANGTWTEWKQLAFLSDVEQHFVTTSIDEIPTSMTNGIYPFKCNSPIEIGDGVTMPTYTKGVFISTGHDMALIAVDEHGKLYTAYMSEYVWANSSVTDLKLNTGAITINTSLVSASALTLQKFGHVCIIAGYIRPASDIAAFTTFATVEYRAAKNNWVTVLPTGNDSTKIGRISVGGATIDSDTILYSGRYYYFNIAYITND